MVGIGYENIYAKIRWPFVGKSSTKLQNL